MIIQRNTINPRRIGLSLPEAPEPFDCPGETEGKMIEEVCEHCSEYERCKKAYSKYLKEED